MTNSTLSLSLSLASTLFLALSMGTAFAGADPLPTSQFPTLRSIDAAGNDIVFDKKYRLVNGEWQTWPNPHLDNKNPNKQSYKPKKFSCSIPSSVLQKYRNEVYRAEVLYCDIDRIWFSISSYCSEGANAQGRLFSYQPVNASVTEYKDFIPHCESIESMVRVGNEIWTATVTPGEYGPYGGSGILVFDLKTNKLSDTQPKPTTLTDNVLNAIGYQPSTNTIWVATRAGLDRYLLGNKKWEHRYFDINISPDNKLHLVLSSSKPNVNRLWMAFHLYFYPIDNPTGFAKAWSTLGTDRLYPPVKHIKLLPYYISALLNMDEKWNDYSFVYLLKHIGKHKEGHQQIQKLLKKLAGKNLSTIRQSAVVELSAEYGMSGANESMDAHFIEMETKFFSTGKGLRELCQFSFKNTKYLKELNDYYIKNTIHDDVNGNFLDNCVRVYSGWQGSEIFLPTILKALSRDDSWSLTSICSMFNHYSKSQLRVSEAIIPILTARLKMEPRIRRNWDTVCIPASYWITNTATGINALLSEIHKHPELHTIAIDVLIEITGKQFSTITAWQNWWKRAQDTFKPSKKKYYWKAR